MVRNPGNALRHSRNAPVTSELWSKHYTLLILIPDGCWKEVSPITANRSAVENEKTHVSNCPHVQFVIPHVQFVAVR